MEIEFEATFPNINKIEIRQKLKRLKAVLKKPEFMQKRVVFNLPKGHEIEGGWLRVRDEGDQVTMSLKIIDGNKIENQKEICLIINDFQQAESFLSLIGCQKKAYQESKRELWILNDTEITIDEWPFLEPLVEVEGKSEEIVKQISEKLGFNYQQAVFCSVDQLYNLKYGISQEIINNHTPEIIFGGKNPFLKT